MEFTYGVIERGNRYKSIYIYMADGRNGLKKSQMLPETCVDRPGSTRECTHLQINESYLQLSAGLGTRRLGPGRLCSASPSQGFPWPLVLVCSRKCGCFGLHWVQTRFKEEEEKKTTLYAI